MAVPIVEKGEKYTCVLCNRELIAGWGHEEAEQDRKDLYGEGIQPDDSLICDDCYKEWSAKGFLPKSGNA